MAILFTGDTHADFSRLKRERFPEQRDLSKEDYLIICGDFGGVWDGSKRQEMWLDWLDRKSFTTLFVTGNHENYDLLARYPAEIWRGGQIRRIRPSVLLLMRGQIYEIDGKKFFTMGGASSHDIPDGILQPDDRLFKWKLRRMRRRGAFFRINHVSWWKEELPDEEEYRTARANLDRHGWAVDYIITHCAPTSVQQDLQDQFGLDSYAPDALTDFLEEVARRCQCRLWFFGHYHANCVVRGKFILLYEKIVRLKADDEKAGNSVEHV